MGEAGDVERRAPVTVTVLAQVEVVAGAMQPDRQQADAVPVVEPPMDERQLGRLGLDEHGGERGPETSGRRHAGSSSLGGSGRPKHRGRSGPGQSQARPEAARARRECRRARTRVGWRHLVEGAPEVRQDPQGDQVDADEGLQA